MSSITKAKFMFKALEPVSFYGSSDQVQNWLYQLELFFEANALDYTGTDKVQCAAIAGALMKGTALNWHRRSKLSGTLPDDYPSLKVELKTQFGQIDENRHYRDILYELKQTHGVLQYIDRFEEAILHVDDASETELIHKFCHGLKGPVKTSVLTRAPTSLHEAMQFAMCFEDVRYGLHNLSKRSYAPQDESVPMELGHAIRNRRPPQKGKRQLNQSTMQSNSRAPTDAPRGRHHPRCWNCGKSGHYASDCTLPAQSQPQQRHYGRKGRLAAIQQQQPQNGAGAQQPPSKNGQQEPGQS